jgi:hypothetical protein
LNAKERRWSRASADGARFIRRRVFTIAAYLLLLTALRLLPETHGLDLAVMSEPVRA